MTRCFIALGSNLGEPLAQLTTALRAIDGIADTRLLAHSPWYRSRALGPGLQPDYLNGVAELETSLDARELLSRLQAIETAQGRERGERWTARTLDLDILLYGNLRLEEPGLSLPHPRMQTRNFVLYPLYDLAPDLVLPCGTALGSLLARCPRDGLQEPGELSDPGM